MMTIRKLASMKGRSRLRKIALLFRQCSVSGCDPHYLASLDRIRSPYNVGSIFRNADAFAIKKIYLIEGSADPGHSRSVRTSRGTVATVDHEVVTEDRLFEIVRALALPILALESGGVDITTFPFPEAGIAVIGGEEVGVTPSLLRLCDASLGRATIMMGGTKGSLNVASATAIMLQRWYTS